MLPFNEFVKTLDASVTKEIYRKAIDATNQLDSEPEKTAAISYATTISLLERYYNWCKNQ